MDILAQLTEYKTKFEALAGKAAQAERFEEEATKILEEKNILAASLVEKDAALLAINEKATALEAEVATLKAEIEKRDADKKASDEKALEIVASLGLKEIPVITVTSTDKPTAESIREKYLAISDPMEKGKFFNENRKAILNGVVE